MNKITRTTAATTTAMLIFAGAVFAESNTPLVVAGNTEFGLALYQQLRSEPGNLFFSPHSISTALAMTYAGARGQTAEEMAKTLRFTLPADELHPAFAKLQEHLNALQKAGHVQLSAANSLWAQRDFKFLDDFLALTKKNYGAGLRQVDFKNDTESARKTINAWVEKETRDKIKDLLKPGVLNRMTRLVLCNAIYFKGNWAAQFDKKATQNADFHVTTGQTVRVAMMAQTEQKCRFGKFDAVRALELPYQGNELSMVAFLPNAVDGLPAWEKQLTPANLQLWLGTLASAPPVKVNVFLPKFKTTSEFSLGKVLAAMGMSNAFGDAADFSGMTGQRDFTLREVVHKAFVDVNEEGTEAAAATAVIMAKAAAIEETPPEFRADHPFVFLIRNNATGAVLFLGRVIDPTK